MIEKLQQIAKIPELKKKIIYTLIILFVCRFGVHIPLPGINVAALGHFFKEAQSASGLLGMFDMFTGGAFQKAAIFALGIMPYISASIIIQLLGSVFPTIAKMQKEEEGRRKITQWTRYSTVILSVAQGWGVAIFLESIKTAQGLTVVPMPGLAFKLMTMLTLATGTMILMWLGEQITNKGLGNGISLIIMLGIIARFPNAISEEVIQLKNGNREIVFEIILWVGMLGAIAACYLLTQGMRKITVHYAKRNVGGKASPSQVSHIPLRINLTGVMPIIFAQSIMFVPSTVASILPDNSVVKYWIQSLFDYQSYSYMGIYMLVIIFFSYFYTAIAFNPVDVSNNLKQGGAFIPGVKPGNDTAEYIDNVLSKITLPGAIFLGLIAIMPNIIVKVNPGVSYSLAAFFGGTSLIILVGVALDTLQQVESYFIMHHYDGFIKTGKIQGRRK